MELIVVTPEDMLPDEGDAVNLLFDCGLASLHLRKPGASIREMAMLLDRINPRYHKKVVIHDHFELTREYSLKGIHLNSRNPHIPSYRNGTVSGSCHSVAELRDCKDYDYLFLSPVFNSISKKGYMSAFTELELTEAKQAGLINRKVYALGGISQNTISAAESYGFGGVVVLGALWSAYSVDLNTNALINRFIKLIKECNL